MCDERGSSGSVILAFLLGGVIGAGVALLTAPQSGRETREKMRGYADEGRKKASEYSGQAKEKMREFADESRNKASEYAGQAKEKLSSAVDSGKHYVEDKKSLIANAYEAGKEAFNKEKDRQTKG